MPADHGVGLHDQQSRTPIRPDTRQQRPENPVAPPEPRRFRFLLENGELLSKGEILSGEFGSVAKNAA